MRASQRHAPQTAASGAITDEPGLCDILQRTSHFGATADDFGSSTAIETIIDSHAMSVGTIDEPSACGGAPKEPTTPFCG